MANDTFTRLTASVATDRSVKTSAIAVLADLAQKIRDTAGDPAAANALADDLDSSSADLSAAIANTTGTPVA
jgi:hypothetical protein